MSREPAAKQLMDAFSSGQRFREQPKTGWRDSAENLARSRLGIPPAELSLAAKDRNAWRSEFERLLPQPQKDKQKKENALN